MILRELQEEKGQAQTAMQQELLAQRQQLELHIARLTEQHQEVTCDFLIYFLYTVYDLYLISYIVFQSGLLV